MTLSPEEVSILDALDHELPVGEGYLICDHIKSIPRLIADLADARSRAIFSDAVKAMWQQDMRTLIARIQTTENPLMLWAIHVHLDTRQIPPRLRWPACDGDEQYQFFTWLPDVLWIAKRNPDHKAGFKSWQGAFKHAPATRKLHLSLHARYLYTTRKPRSANYYALGLALSETQRKELMTFQTNKMRAITRRLNDIASVREKLLTHAVAHPDKAGLHSPADIARRRSELWKIYQLTGENQTETVHYYREITGQRITRQTLAKQLILINKVLAE